MAKSLVKKILLQIVKIILKI